MSWGATGTQQTRLGSHTYGDAKTIEAEVTQAQDTAAVCYHNGIHFLCWPVPYHSRLQ